MPDVGDDGGAWSDTSVSGVDDLDEGADSDLTDSLTSELAEEDGASETSLLVTVGLDGMTPSSSAF